MAVSCWIRNKMIAERIGIGALSEAEQLAAVIPETPWKNETDLAWR
jgi:hypothetical protein